MGVGAWGVTGIWDCLSFNLDRASIHTDTQASTHPDTHARIDWRLRHHHAGASLTLDIEHHVLVIASQSRLFMGTNFD